MALFERIKLYMQETTEKKREQIMQTIQAMGQCGGSVAIAAADTIVDITSPVFARGTMGICGSLARNNAIAIGLLFFFCLCFVFNVCVCVCVLCSVCMGIVESISDVLFFLVIFSNEKGEDNIGGSTIKKIVKNVSKTTNQNT